VEAVELECDYAGRSGGCEVRKADLSENTILETFTFSGTQEQKEIATGIRFQLIGRVAHLPPNLVEEFPKLTDLSIRWSEVLIVKNNLFGRQFSWIKELYLGENNIKMIEDEAFQHLPNLEEISLYDNEIKSLGAKVFENNSKLKVIWLHDNKINMISPETFRNLNQLKSVDFEGNECFSKPIGCWNCYDNIDHTELNSALLPCYENHKKSTALPNDGENNLEL
jgi:Leucine-rich repeat (LRR) protein